MYMNESPKALVIGYGSIGQRHARLLTELGLNTACVTKQQSAAHKHFPDISVALRTWRPQYVVIASPTARHASDLTSVLEDEFQGPILIEKPMFADLTTLMKPLTDSVFVGYNLRFLDAVGQLKDILADQQVLTVSIWNAQYLPDWRPGRDYRTTGSAYQSAGGGVLRDLSHGLDLLLYLFGRINSVQARIKRTGTLEIDTEDCVLASLSTNLCETVSMYLSYLDRIPRHEIRVTTTQASIHCDLLSGEIATNNSRSTYTPDRDETFRRMHRAVLSNDRTTVCSVADGMSTVRTINALEQSALTKTLVTL